MLSGNGCPPPPPAINPMNPQRGRVAPPLPQASNPMNPRKGQWPLLRDRVLCLGYKSMNPLRDRVARHRDSRQHLTLLEVMSAFSFTSMSILRCISALYLSSACCCLSRILHTSHHTTPHDIITSHNIT